MPSLTLRLRNHFDELPGLAESVETFLHEQSAGTEAVFAANLALEELVTNIVKYGYDDAGPHEISIHLEVGEGVLRLVISDDGHPFNPFDQPEPDTSLPAEERDIGGLGIHFVRNMLDTCSYERVGDANVVTLTKNL